MFKGIIFSGNKNRIFSENIFIRHLVNKLLNIIFRFLIEKYVFDAIYAL